MTIQLTHLKKFLSSLLLHEKSIHSLNTYFYQNCSGLTILLELPSLTKKVEILENLFQLLRLACARYLERLRGNINIERIAFCFQNNVFEFFLIFSHKFHEIFSTFFSVVRWLVSFLEECSDPILVGHCDTVWK